MHLYDKAQKDPLHDVLVKTVSLLHTLHEKRESQGTSPDIVTIEFAHLLVLGEDILLINKALRWLAGQGVVGYWMLPPEMILKNIERSLIEGKVAKAPLFETHEVERHLQGISLEDVDELVPEHVKNSEQYIQARSRAEQVSDLQEQVLSLIAESFNESFMFMVWISDLKILEDMHNSQAFGMYYQSYKR